MSVKVFDFFSGCGGTSAGLRAAGLDIVFGLDIDADSAATFQHNFPDATFLLQDIQTLEPSSLQPLFDHCGGEPVLFSGCAPCQPFSIQNRTRKVKQDDRSSLLQRFGEFVAYFRPDYVLIENVPGIQQVSAETPGPLAQFLRRLKKLHYDYDFKVIRSQDYGVPQRRNRLVLIASKHGAIRLPEPTHGPEQDLFRLRYKTAWETIQGLPPLKAGEAHPVVPNHVCATLDDINLARIRATPEGGDRRDWPSDLVLTCHKQKGDQAPFTGHMDVYGRIRKHQPASGLTTRCISLSNGRFGHPEQDRALSVREAACLQTFPMDFYFHGTMTSTARQVGNAVPVLLAQSLGNTIMGDLAVRTQAKGALSDHAFPG